MSEHVHRVHLRVTRIEDGERIYNAEGPCETCGEVLVALPSVRDVRITWPLPVGATATRYAVGEIPSD